MPENDVWNEELTAGWYFAVLLPIIVMARFLKR